MTARAVLAVARVDPATLDHSALVDPGLADPGLLGGGLVASASTRVRRHRAARTGRLTDSRTGSAS